MNACVNCVVMTHVADPETNKRAACYYPKVTRFSRAAAAVLLQAAGGSAESGGARGSSALSLSPRLRVFVEMAKFGDLKAFLESSLNEIFRATVRDILCSVEHTVGEYQSQIQRIESENQDLRKRLSAKDNKTNYIKTGNLENYIIAAFFVNMCN